MWTILIPYLGLYFYEFYQTQALPRRFAWHLWLIGSFALISYKLSLTLKIVLWLFLVSYQWIQWFLSFRFKLELSFNLLFFLRKIAPFISSLATLSLHRFFLCAVASIALSFLDLASAPFLPFWAGVFILSSIALFYLYPFPKKMDKTTTPSFSFPHEKYLPFSCLYPALRTTFSFLGEKKIPIRIGPQEKPHIIFIFLESFRAKNVGALGAEIPASPHFDKWAKEGVLFRNFHATGQQTFRALISSHFGIPGHIQTPSLRPFCDQPMRGLPQILKEYGYHPAIIQSGDVSFDFLSPFFQRHGFSTILGAEQLLTKEERFNSWGLDDAKMFEKASCFLEKQTSPTFLTLFTITNHHPWEKPPHWNFPVDPNLPSYYQRFLQTFSYTDACLGNFLETLQEKNLLEKSILFISADHGQTMHPDPAIRDLNQGSMQEQLHIPLLLLAKNRVSPTNVEMAANFLDFLPTVLDLLQIPATHHSLGKSLLRDREEPIYFSICKQESEIGSIFQSTKQIFTNQNCEAALRCKTFFENIRTLYKEKKWAPPSKEMPPLELKATKEMDDKAYLALLEKAAPHFTLNLSASSQLTDAAFLKAPIEKASYWQQLILTNCTLLTDATLYWIAQNCPHLTSLHLSYCHLITDKGVENILKECKELRHIYLDGIEELENCIPKTPLSLKTSSLLWLPALRFSSLLAVFENAKDLLDWSVCLSLFTDAEIETLGNFPKKTVRMHLVQGIKIGDRAIQKLLLAQKDLQEIHLEDFPLLETLDFSLLQKLRSLTLINCPNISQNTLDSLKGLPLLRFVKEPPSPFAIHVKPPLHSALKDDTQALGNHSAAKDHLK